MASKWHLLVASKLAFETEIPFETSLHSGLFSLFPTGSLSAVPGLELHIRMWVGFPPCPPAASGLRERHAHNGGSSLGAEWVMAIPYRIGTRQGGWIRFCVQGGILCVRCLGSTWEGGRDEEARSWRMSEARPGSLSSLPECDHRILPYINSAPLAHSLSPRWTTPTLWWFCFQLCLLWSGLIQTCLQCWICLSKENSQMLALLTYR